MRTCAETQTYSVCVRVCVCVCACVRACVCVCACVQNTASDSLCCVKPSTFRCICSLMLQLLRRLTLLRLLSLSSVNFVSKLPASSPPPIHTCSREERNLHSEHAQLLTSGRPHEQIFDDTTRIVYIIFHIKHYPILHRPRPRLDARTGPASSSANRNSYCVRVVRVITIVVRQRVDCAGNV
jgi:hypothetical protein